MLIDRIRLPLMTKSPLHAGSSISNNNAVSIYCIELLTFCFAYLAEG